MKLVIATGRGKRSFFYPTVPILIRYAELEEKTLFFYDEHTNKRLSHSEALARAEDEPYFWPWMLTVDLGPEIPADYDWENNFFIKEEILRDSQGLILAVEELAPEELKVVEIPDDVDYYIEECEMGGEIIREKHRTWS